MPHWTLHLSISHSPAVPLPATCRGDASQIPHCENHMIMKIMIVAPFLKKEKYPMTKVISPSQKPDPCVCHLGCVRGQLVAGDTRQLGSSSTGARTIVL